MSYILYTQEQYKSKKFKICKTYNLKHLWFQRNSVCLTSLSHVALHNMWARTKPTQFTVIKERKGVYNKVLQYFSVLRQKNIVGKYCRTDHHHQMIQEPNAAMLVSRGESNSPGFIWVWLFKLCIIYFYASFSSSFIFLCISLHPILLYWRHLKQKR